MSPPTRGETFSRLTEHLRKAQEQAAMMSHLVRDESALKAQGWLAVAEMLRNTVKAVTELATKGLQ